MIRSKFTSSIEKIFIDESLDSYPTLSRISVLRGERLSFQFIVKFIKEGDEANMNWTTRLMPTLGGTLASFAGLRRVDHVPVTRPVSAFGTDDNYLRTSPGLFPDVLAPLQYGGKIAVASDMLLSTWIEIEIPDNIAPGAHSFSLSLDGGSYGKTTSTLDVEVIDARLPESELIFTQWFHCDGLANYYRVPVFSEEHWRIIENFAKTAKKNGINLLLTPVFTPPLDTAVGGERLTTQLVDVRSDGGVWSFGFEKLDRWIEMCDRVGIKYLEISHLFTQWGASHAPKIMAYVDGEYKKVFGWGTDALSDEYRAFLSEFLRELVRHLKSGGNFERCVFHVSDEPGLDHLETYKSAKSIMTEAIGDAYIMDALSKFEFYKTGAVDHPVVASNHIEPFIEAKVPGLFTYYCVSQWQNVSNRYHSMPAWRTRCIGMQLFKFDIAGFLHWGYNFYNNQYSEDSIDPFLDQCSGNGFIGGDSHSVYPAPNGEAYESTRLVVFHEALADLSAMKLLSSLIGKERVVYEMEKVLGFEIRFDKCVRSSSAMLALRERINELIKEAVSKEK